jgi:hypothetical protein
MVTIKYDPSKKHHTVFCPATGRAQHCKSKGEAKKIQADWEASLGTTPEKAPEKAPVKAVVKKATKTTTKKKK